MPICYTIMDSFFYGKYIYRFSLDENGIVEEVEVEMTIDKSYSWYSWIIGVH